MNVTRSKREFIIYAPDIHQGDAVGNHCLGVYRLAERLGFEPIISAIRSTYDESVYRTQSVESVLDSSSEERVLFVSYSIYDENFEVLASKKCKKICYFHNVTTPNLLEEFEPITAELCRKSAEQFSLLNHFDLLICNSEFTKTSLDTVGDKAIVIPPVFSDQLNTFMRQPNVIPCDKRNALTYVGRVVPHKKVEDLILVVSQAKKHYGMHLKLNIIGNECNHIYSTYLRNLASQLGIEDQCTFYGSIPLDQMLSILLDTDVYVTASEHEGFCIPVLEASLMGIPSLVKGGSAAEELLNDSELVFETPEDATNRVNSLLSSEDNYSKSCRDLHVTIDRIFSTISDDNWNKVIERVI